MSACGSMRLARFLGWAFASLILGCAAQRAPIGVTAQVIPTEQSKISDALQAPSASALALPAALEELWVIEKPAGGIAQPPNQILPGSATLLTRQGKNVVVCPLDRMDVKARITGMIASVDVSQQFTNPTREPAEAVYAFPLPASATITDFIVTIGTRQIRAIIRERKEAQEIYRQARQQGYLVSLLSEREPNVFVQSIGNLEPGKAVQIQTQYVHPLRYADGWFIWNFPLFNGARGASWHQSAERPGTNLSVSLTLEAGMAIERVECPTHSMSIVAGDPFHAVATLNQAERIPNTDLVLRFKPAGEGVSASLFTQQGDAGGGGFFALTIVPPTKTDTLPRRPIDAIFVLDVKGIQMRDRAAMAIGRALEKLEDEDRFTLVYGDDGARFDSLAPANLENRSRALQSLHQWAPKQSRPAELLQSVLKSPAEAHARTVFFLTDGKSDLRSRLADLRPIIARTQIVVMPLDTGPHSREAAALSYLGHGALARVDSGQDVERTVDALMDALTHPALVNPTLDWKGAKLTDLLPPAQPLLVGHPLLITGRFQGQAPPEVVVQENGSAKIAARAIPLPAGRTSAHLGAIWARMKMTDIALGNSDAANPPVDERIRQLAMEFGLVSPFTSYICVDARTRSAPPSPAP